MTKDDILQALHQAAMGRARTPLQVELAEALERLTEPAWMPTEIVDRSISPTETPLMAAAKRTRKQRAE